MSSSIPKSTILDQTYKQLKNPQTFDELNYGELIKAIDAQELKALDQTIDLYGTTLISELGKTVKLRTAIRADLVRIYTKWGTRCSLAGAASFGAAHLTDDALSKAIFVAGIILFSSGAAQFLYSGRLLHNTSKYRLEAQKMAEDIAHVQKRMRLRIQSKLVHRENDQVVDRGVEKFNRHDQNFTDHKKQLTVHGQTLASHNVKFGDLKTVNKEQANKLVEQEKKLVARDYEIDECRNKISMQESKLIEQDKKLALQDETLRALLERFSALENSQLARAN